MMMGDESTEQRDAFSRRTAVVLALAVAALLIGGTWFYSTQKRDYLQRVSNELAAIARLKANQIVSWRGERLGDAAVLMENPFLAASAADWLASPGSGRDGSLRALFQSLRNHYGYTDILLVDPAGTVRLSLSGSWEMHACYREAMTEALHRRKPVFTDLHMGPGHPKPHISIVAPLFAGKEDNGGPLGAIILVSDATQFLYPLVQSWPTPTTSGETLLVSRAGNDALFLNDPRQTPDAALKLRIPLTRTDAPAVMAVLGRKGVVEGKDYRGAEVVAAILPVPGSPWFIVAKVDASEIIAAWRFRQGLILGLFIALLGGMGALGLAIMNRRQKVHSQSLYRAEADLRASEERHGITLNAIGDAVIATDSRGVVELLNPVAEQLTGWTRAEAEGRPLEEVFPIISEETRDRVENPVHRVLREERIVGLANHTLLLARDGREIPIADSAAPIRDHDGRITGVVLVFRDQTEDRRVRQLLQARLTLLEYATTHSLDDVLTRALDLAGDLVDSPIGFYHMVDADQRTLFLQQWSSRTLREFCRTEGRGLHYSLDQAGVWADALRERRPVIHNDYASLPGKKGMPEGHAEVVRELVVPITREGRVAAILGVGNKPEDYTEKDVEAVSYLADVTWEIIVQKRTEAVLRDERQRLANIIEGTNVGTWEWNIVTGETVFNERWAGIAGYSLDELAPTSVETWKSLAHPDDLRKSKEQLELHFSGELPYYDCICRMRHRNGSWVWVHTRGRVVTWTEDGLPLMMFGTHNDITEQVSAEEEHERLREQLHQAQKMESVGRLAGGVAHDFNNMLGVILGHVELALMRSASDRALFNDLTAIRTAAERSAELVRQLLAFARKQTIAPRVLDLNRTVAGMLQMLGRLIGEDISLAWVPGEGVWPVRMDPSQLDQILANLCVNARDAIAGVGRITIETASVVFDDGYCSRHAGFVSGEFVRLAVSDDGCGMDKETQDMIFEPFFTTKGVGKGTGLGLAMVFGIVKQNNGFINVSSEPGRGSTFSIYIPRDTVESPQQAADAPQPVTKGNETVLLVEDEAEILEIGRLMLESLGYTVVTAGTPAEAMALALERAGGIRLLITDVIMPEMNGRDLAHRIRSHCPGLACLFMSGYTEDVIAHRGVLDKGVHFIQKPFSLRDLAAKAREALDDADSIPFTP
jgi:PAS domain S-box-containing protein